MEDIRGPIAAPLSLPQAPPQPPPYEKSAPVEESAPPQQDAQASPQAHAANGNGLSGAREDPTTATEAKDLAYLGPGSSDMASQVGQAAKALNRTEPAQSLSPRLPDRCGRPRWLGLHEETLGVSSSLAEGSTEESGLVAETSAKAARAGQLAKELVRTEPAQSSSASLPATGRATERAGPQEETPGVGFEMAEGSTEGPGLDAALDTAAAQSAGVAAASGQDLHAPGSFERDKAGVPKLQEEPTGGAAAIPGDSNSEEVARIDVSSTKEQAGGDRDVQRDPPVVATPPPVLSSPAMNGTSTVDGAVERLPNSARASLSVAAVGEIPPPHVETKPAVEASHAVQPGVAHPRYEP